MSYGHSVPAHSTIILLRPAADGSELNGVLEKRHRRGHVYVTFPYDVVRIWDQPVEEILTAGLPLLPLSEELKNETAAVFSLIEHTLGLADPLSEACQMFNEDGGCRRRGRISVDALGPHCATTAGRT